MCESSVYLKEKDSEEELVMENVTSVMPLGENRFQISGLFGEQMEIAGTLVQVDLLGHKILFEKAS